MISVIIEKVGDFMIKLIKLIKLITYMILLFIKDFRTGLHCIRVGFKMYEYSQLIDGKRTEMSAIKAFLYGFFHDVGKLGVSNKVLHKKGRITSEEFEYIKTHVSNKYAMVAEYLFPGIMDHHENMNGEGYFKKKPEEVNAYGKLLAIIDVQDALSHKREYKEAYNKETVLYIMEDMRLKGKFDVSLYNKVIKLA